MVKIIIIVLIVALVALLIDWGALRKKGSLSFANPFAKKRQAGTPSFRAARKAEVKAARQQEPADFDFEGVPEEAPAVPFFPEEEPAEAYQPNREVEALLAEADVCFRKGEMKAAENFYVQAAAKDPRCSKAYSRLGVIYLETGDNWEDAEAAFRQALKTDPDNGFVLNNLGLVLYHQDRYADAIRHFELAVRQDEYNAARHANLGMAYLAMRQYAKAESSFKKALKLNPGEMEYKDLLNESIEKKKAHKLMVRR